MGRSNVKICKHFVFGRCAQIYFNKKYYQTEIILHSCIKQYRSFGLSNITRIMRISTTDYTSPIATVEDTSSYVMSRWPRYVEICHIMNNNKSTTLASDQKRQ